MTANEYRAKAERFREAARKLWTGSEDRDVLLKFARAYDLLTKATETLAKPPIGSAGGRGGAMRSGRAAFKISTSTTVEITGGKIGGMAREMADFLGFWWRG